MWSAAVLLPALPGRSIPARALLPPLSGVPGEAGWPRISGRSLNAHGKPGLRDPILSASRRFIERSETMSRYKPSARYLMV